jgi:GNAT superfamily N-acetyltransferase
MSVRCEALGTLEGKEHHKASVQRLFERVFARPLSDADWHHLIIGSPYEAGFLAVALDGDKIVGTANFIPQKLTWEGSVLDYFLFTTSMVDPDYRRHGVYMQTTRLAIDEARRSGKSFIVAFPNDVALRPLTTLFRFKPVADHAIVSGSLAAFGRLAPLDQRRSVRLDADFLRWRLTHRDYFRVSNSGLLLLCKRYRERLDIVEVLDGMPPGMESLLPERDEQLVNVNLLSARCSTPAAGSVLATLHLTCYTLRDDVDPSRIDLSLLMWDVI